MKTWVEIEGIRFKYMTESENYYYYLAPGKSRVHRKDLLTTLSETKVPKRVLKSESKIVREE